MSISQQTAKEIIDTMRHLARHKSVPIEWTRRDHRLPPRAYDVLRLIEQACDEGRDIYASEIVEKLNRTPGRIQQLIKRLIDEKRITRRKKTAKGLPLTIHFTPEDFAA